MGVGAMTTWAEEIVRLLEPELEALEVFENDGRHGIGSPWLVVRGRTRMVPLEKPGTVYIGDVRRPYVRRLYVHPSGYLVEGGRGGARIFFAGVGYVPHPFISPIDSIRTVARARSIRFAVDIADALSRMPA